MHFECNLDIFTIIMSWLVKADLLLHSRDMGSDNASYTLSEVHLSLEGNEEKVVSILSFSLSSFKTEENKKQFSPWYFSSCQSVCSNHLPIAYIVEPSYVYFN